MGYQTFPFVLPPEQPRSLEGAGEERPINADVPRGFKGSLRRLFIDAPADALVRLEEWVGPDEPFNAETPTDAPQTPDRPE